MEHRLLRRVIHGHDIGMVELGDGLGLAEQFLATLGTEAEFREDFDRDISVQHSVVGTVDNAHATAPQLGCDFKTLVENRAYHGLSPSDVG